MRRRRRGRAFVKITAFGHMLGLYVELSCDEMQTALPVARASDDQECLCAVFDESGRDFLCSSDTEKALSFFRGNGFEEMDSLELSDRMKAELGHDAATSIQNFVWRQFELE